MSREVILNNSFNRKQNKPIAAINKNADRIMKIFIFKTSLEK